jgi:hypothetical protein
MQQPSPVQARLSTLYGAEVIVVTCNPADDGLLLIGFMIFPDEEIDLSRRAEFVVINHRGTAILFTADSYERLCELAGVGADGGEPWLPIYSFALETSPDAPSA